LIYRIKQFAVPDVVLMSGNCFIHLETLSAGSSKAVVSSSVTANTLLGSFFKLAANDMIQLSLGLM